MPSPNEDEDWEYEEDDDDPIDYDDDWFERMNWEEYGVDFDES